MFTEKLERETGSPVISRRTARRTSSLTDLTKFQMASINEPTIDEEEAEPPVNYDRSRRPSRFSIAKVDEPLLPPIKTTDKAVSLSL